MADLKYTNYLKAAIEHDNVWYESCETENVDHEIVLTARPVDDRNKKDMLAQLECLMSTADGSNGLSFVAAHPMLQNPKGFLVYNSSERTFDQGGREFKGSLFVTDKIDSKINESSDNKYNANNYAVNYLSSRPEKIDVENWRKQLSEAWITYDVGVDTKVKSDDLYVYAYIIDSLLQKKKVLIHTTQSKSSPKMFLKKALNLLPFRIANEFGFHCNAVDEKMLKLVDIACCDKEVSSKINGDQYVKINCDNNEVNKEFTTSFAKYLRVCKDKNLPFEKLDADTIEQLEKESQKKLNEIEFAEKFIALEKLSKDFKRKKSMDDLKKIKDGYDELANSGFAGCDERVAKARMTVVAYELFFTGKYFDSNENNKKFFKDNQKYFKKFLKIADYPSAEIGGLKLSVVDIVNNAKEKKKADIVEYIILLHKLSNDSDVFNPILRANWESFYYDYAQWQKLWEDESLFVDYVNKLGWQNQADLLTKINLQSMTAKSLKSVYVSVVEKVDDDAVAQKFDQLLARAAYRLYLSDEFFQAKEGDLTFWHEHLKWNCLGDEQFMHFPIELLRGQAQNGNAEAVVKYIKTIKDMCAKNEIDSVDFKKQFDKFYVDFKKQFDNFYYDRKGWVACFGKDGVLIEYLRGLEEKELDEYLQNIRGWDKNRFRRLYDDLLSQKYSYQKQISTLEKMIETMKNNAADEKMIETMKNNAAEQAQVVDEFFQEIKDSIQNFDKHFGTNSYRAIAIKVFNSYSSFNNEDKPVEQKKIALKKWKK